MVSKYDVTLFGIAALLAKGTTLQVLGFPALPIAAMCGYALLCYAVFIDPPV